MKAKIALNSSYPKIKIGTRGSPLALVQTQIVIDLLTRSLRSDQEFEIKKIVTEGDLASQKGYYSDSRKDSFTRTIDRALAAGDVDLAVHSLKDIPLGNFDSKEIEIVSFPRRDKSNDVLISKSAGETLSTLPEGAKIGTGSPRRAGQLIHYRSDFQIVEIRGNVQTRIEKLRNGSSIDAIVLARAGLDRLGLGNNGWDIPLQDMLPAAGQGAIAVAVRKDDSFVRNIALKIDDKKVRTCVLAEIAFTRELEAGCRLPTAAHGTLSASDPDKLVLEGLIISDTSEIKRSKLAGHSTRPEALGLELASRLR